jgi:hypothetical protein
MKAEEQRAVLNEPTSQIRQFLAETAKEAGRSDYLVVVPYPPLNDAFEQHVLQKLHVKRLNPSSKLVPIYQIQPPAVHGEL